MFVINKLKNYWTDFKNSFTIRKCYIIPDNRLYLLLEKMGFLLNKKVNTAVPWLVRLYTAQRAMRWGRRGHRCVGEGRAYTGNNNIRAAHTHDRLSTQRTQSTLNILTIFIANFFISVKKLFSELPIIYNYFLWFEEKNFLTICLKEKRLQLSKHSSQGRLAKLRHIGESFENSDRLASQKEYAS